MYNIIIRIAGETRHLLRKHPLHLQGYRPGDMLQHASTLVKSGVRNWGSVYICEGAPWELYVPHNLFDLDRE